jgi:EAL domain-containing protein (putative c-di-GMP-specific phosphodiesterase class I)
VEALMRWYRPDLGAIPPTEFIPIAEDTGLIHQLGDWALEHACEQAKRWHDAGYRDLTLAVNVSVRQLADPNIAERVISILRRTGLRASALELEITENLLLQPTDDILRLLNDLTELGVRLTVDDFGIGYSSLSYLHRYPIKALKIDRSFISRIGVALHNDTIVEAIIALAQSLHLHVLAEGVETRAQVDFLRKRGCRVAQGFLFSRPLDADRLTALLEAQGARAMAWQEAELAEGSPSVSSR